MGIHYLIGSILAVSILTKVFSKGLIEDFQLCIPINSTVTDDIECDNSKEPYLVLPLGGYNINKASCNTTGLDESQPVISLGFRQHLCESQSTCSINNTEFWNSHPDNHLLMSLRYKCLNETDIHDGNYGDEFNHAEVKYFQLKPHKGANQEGYCRITSPDHLIIFVDSENTDEFNLTLQNQSGEEILLYGRDNNITTDILYAILNGSTYDLRVNGEYNKIIIAGDSELDIDCYNTSHHNPTLESTPLGSTDDNKNWILVAIGLTIVYIILSFLCIFLYVLCWRQKKKEYETGEKELKENDSEDEEYYTKVTLKRPKPQPAPGAFDEDYNTEQCPNGENI